VTPPGCRVGRWVVLAVLVGLALTGCDRPGPAASELREAAARTLAQDVAFTLSARTDTPPDAAEDAPLAAMLATFELSGVREAGGRYAFAVDIGGTMPLLEARGGAGDPLLLRSGLGALLGAEGDPASELGPQLDELGLEGDQRDALIAGFAGDWIALSDADDVGDLAGRALGEETGGDDGAGGPDGEGGDPFDLERLFAELEVTSARDVGDVRRFEVVVDAQDWLGSDLDAAAQDGGLDVPAAVPGTVTVRDGMVHEVRLQLGAAADGDQPEGQESGGLDLVLVLRDHGEVRFPEPVTPVVEVTVAELAELLSLLGAEEG
jgi:hypothetical protein